ncbi:hydroxyacid dehydrogenase [Mesorhizobium sp. ES1-6]|uniref:hydroxyacid dehydrogenase n=1 Tax=Mesorhizobium sp. ES1-6 TaxID=2876626 RepID=UPI001CCF2973|nr:hydroxyacid dehydrogenase [Mesorhizobium sp. ES1-6]MBZ9801113.1 hydroxyacid dehydrogenase [Mesorhizobium sp. ES1-6]
MKKILVIQPLRAEALALFEERSDVSYEVVTDFSKENLIARVADAVAITVRDAPLPMEVLAAAPNLRIVSRHGVGYDNIPVDYCTGRGVPVTVVGDVNAISVAEQTMFLMLAAARGGIRLDAAIRAGDFGARSRLIGVELRGRTLLIVGFGRIGREVARRATAFGMHILVHDPFASRADHAGARFVERLEDGLAAADILTLHVPLSEATHHLIDAAALKALRPGAIVINAARGGIIDEAALVEALETGHVRSAGLDTFEVEPLPTVHPLVDDRRVVLSPHSAALTEESLLAMGIVTARNALAGIDGVLDPTLVVNPSVLKVATDAQ